METQQENYADDFDDIEDDFDEEDYLEWTHEEEQQIALNCECGA